MHEIHERTDPKSPSFRFGGCIPARDALCMSLLEAVFNGACGILSLYGGLVPLGCSHSNLIRTHMEFFLVYHSLRKFAILFPKTFGYLQTQRVVIW